MTNNKTFRPSFEPKLDHRFKLEFDKDLERLVELAFEITLPKYINGNWGNMTIKFYDGIGLSSTKIVNDFLTKKPTIKDFFKSRTFDFNIHLLDPTGVTVETWIIEGNVIKNVDFGNLSYSADKKSELKIVSITIRPENCFLI